jgi:D-lactate dehydrogenase
MKIAFFGLKEQVKKDYFQNSLTGHEIIFIDQNLDEDTIPQDTNAEIISVFVQSKVTPKVIDAFPHLKLIVIRATGFDNVDTKYAREKGIIVSNVPAYGSHTVAEFTFGLILSLSRKIPQAAQRVKEDVEFDHEGLKGFDLYGKTLGVIGTGKIGANVIKIAKGFGMIILAHDSFPSDQLSKTFEFQYVSLEQLLKESDIVTIHVPASLKTHHLINKDNIFQMKKGSILINSARGDVIETEALYKAISENHLAGAGLDVLEGEDSLDDDLTKEEFEPLEIRNILENSQLIKNPNVLVTPHSAFYTQEAEQAIMQTTVENIQGFIDGTSKNVVN